MDPTKFGNHILYDVTVCHSYGKRKSLFTIENMDKNFKWLHTECCLRNMASWSLFEEALEVMWKLDMFRSPTILSFGPSH